jgi:hypothetical protein
MSHRKRFIQPAFIGNTAFYAAAVLLLIWVMTAAVTEGAEGDRSWERYQLLIKRNIFLKSRSPLRRSESSAQERRTRVSRVDEPRFLLSGVACDNGDCVAFVENLRTNSVSKLQKGQTIAGATLTAISLDGLEYERGSRNSELSIGAVLRSQRSLSAPTTRREDSPQHNLVRSEGVTGSPAPKSVSNQKQETKTDSSDDAASILERMRRRRTQELRQ